MATSTDLIQQLYVAYYNRPADVAGLNYWVAALDGGATIDQISKSFNTAPEYTKAYAGKSPEVIVDTVYMNLFGRHAEGAGLDYWAPKVQSGAISVADLVKQISAGAVGADGTPNADGVALGNKVTAAEAFTTELNAAGNEAERVAYASGSDAALAAAKGFLATVTTDAATLAAALAGVHTAAAGLIPPPPVTIANLTTGVDAIVGGAGNDTINATIATAATNPLGGLDTVDGGAGNDILNIADSVTLVNGVFSLPAGFSVKNVETLNVVTNGSVGTSTAARFDVSGMTGLTTANITSAADGSATDFVKAAGTTAVNFNGTTGALDVSGGSAVTAVLTSGAVTVVGSKLASANITTAGRVIAPAGALGADSVVINDLSSAASTKTLTSVTLNGLNTLAATGAVAGSNGNATLTGDALTNVTLVGNKGNTVTVVNTTTAHTLNVTVTDTGSATANTVVTDVAAKTIALTTSNSAATKTSFITLTGETAATAVTAAGAGKLTLDLTGAASATSFDGSAATGDLTLAGINAGVLSIKTGAGNDTFTTAETVKFAVDAGAGNDIVTLSTAVAAGSTINLGAGNDTLLSVGGSVAASTATGVTVIDGGAGVDNVSASLINAANAAQFKNFEGLDLTAASVLDVELMTGSVIQTLSLNGKSGASTAIGAVSNVAAGVGLSVAGDNTGAGAAATTIAVKGAAAGAADSFTITFAGVDASGTAPTTPTIKTGLVTVNGIESLNLVSNGGTNTYNAANISDDGLQTVTITGSKNLDLVFTGTNGTNDPTNGGGAVKLIDGSAATGKLNINTTNVTADDVVGLTVKGGAANDIFTLAGKATVVAGAGDDTIHAAAGGGTFTGGAGKDVFDLSLTGVAIGGTVTGAGVFKSVITDLGSGDSITFDSVAVAGTLGAKVALDSTVTNLDQALALASANSVAGTITWFQYGSNTYIVENSDGTTGIDAATAGPTAGDIVVKLTGTIDLSTAVVAAHVLTIA